MTADEIIALREGLGLTRVEFARIYRLSPRTLQDWEQGRAGVTLASETLLMLISFEPDLIADLIVEMLARET